ncbi:hypothetical protein V8G54_022308 [Vigna mungo]|uniref:Uncharacterized protein n=1 Tax=Vigna mungo TaxID=3915 RepID=A0AAQ3NHT5_VIGMU
MTATLGLVTNFEDIYRLWAFLSRFLDEDFVEREKWRYIALNEKMFKYEFLSSYCFISLFSHCLPFLSLHYFRLIFCTKVLYNKCISIELLESYKVQSIVIGLTHTLFFKVY